MQRSFTADLVGLSPYSQSKYHATEKLDKELDDAYRNRTWRNHMHVTADGYVAIPPMAIKNALSEAAQFLGIQIPGKGKSTWTKHFVAGILVLSPVVLNIEANSVNPETLFLPSNGVRGDGKRVTKMYPFIPQGWKGSVEIVAVDDLLTPDVIQHHLKEAGSLIGVGRFRPRQNGYYGRFSVSNFKEVKNAMAA